MKWEGYRQAAIDVIEYDHEDIGKRCGTQEVLDLAATIKANGDDMIHPPTVRRGSFKLVCGRDRLAACLLNGMKRIWVHVADCNDDEAWLLERIENAYRRYEPGERSRLLAELSSKVADKIRLTQEGRGTPVPEREVKAKAHKEVARLAGVKPSAVKKAEQREAAKAKPKVYGKDKKGRQEKRAAERDAERAEDAAHRGHDISKPKPSYDPPPGPLMERLAGFDCLDVELTGKQVDDIATTIIDIDEWMATLHELENEVRLLGLMDPPTIRKTAVEEIRASLMATVKLLEAVRPATLCDKCKGNGAGCTSCGFTGIVGKSTRKAAA